MTKKINTSIKQQGVATTDSPRLKVEKRDGTLDVHIALPKRAEQLKKLFGSADRDFYEGLFVQIMDAGIKGHDFSNDRDANFILSVVKGLEPKDQVEAMLASQMAAVQMATMTLTRTLAHAENIPQQDSAIRGFTKLTRCFTTQVEALKKYRSNGQQKVIVEHVTVNEGGQAIVGNVDQGGGANK
jgi:uncharacterized protein YjgD (DUF1641 family)